MTTQMQISEQLTQFGLNKNQAETYLALLELGQSSVIDISRKTRIKRTTVYEIIAELEKKHLIAQTKKGNKRLFVAEDPESLGKIIEEKQKRLEKLMPALKSLVNTTGEKPVIRYYEGIEGIKDVYRDTLKYRGELYAFVTENIIKKLGTQFADEYRDKRKKAQIEVRAIGPNTEEIIEYKKGDIKDIKETRLVSKEEFPFTIEMNIYGNKIAFMSFPEQLGLIIESTEIAKNMKFLFQLAWKGAGEEKMEEKNNSNLKDETYWT